MKVSVMVVAYNHEAYIEQAVRSVLAQRTSFDYEIVIGEDCSTDRTLEILLDLQAQHPDKIRLLTTDHNLGMIENSIRTFKACQGEYVALLDGDDYWCAEDKLQTQVDFLDQHPDFALCFHSVLQVNQDSAQPPKVMQPNPLKDVYEITDLIHSNFIQTCSAVLRNEAIDQFPRWAYDLNLLDWLMFIMAAQNGKIKYIDQVMGAYRVHSLGFWSSMSPMKRLTTYLIYFENLDVYLDYLYSPLIQSSLTRYWRKMMDLLYEQAILQDTVRAASAFMRENYSALGTRVELPIGWRIELLERVYCYFLSSNHESGNYPQAWSAWLRLMVNSPSLLKNRGLVLMGLESVCNGRLRWLAQRLRQNHKDGQDG